MGNKVKVLLAAYNGERFIKDQIKSIINQEDVEVSVTLSDDSSDDSTLEIVKKYFENVDVVVNSPRKGSAAKNFLAQILSTCDSDRFDYFSFSDQDDIWESKKLHRAIECIKENKAALYASNLTLWNMETNSYSLLKKDYKQKKYDYLFEGGSAGCTYVMTSDFFNILKERVGRLDFYSWKDLSHDWLVYFIARSMGYKVFIDSKSYIKYRIHGSNVHGHLNSSSWRAFKEKTQRVLGGYYQEHAKNYVKLLENKSPEARIYKSFLGNYFERNFTILRYNTQLMRSNKKFLVFALLNLIKVR
ncbi:MAG: glycosyltransferase [Bergeyella sp.]|nr:glycosyltransferase [Bergeyella sp.]